MESDKAAVLLEQVHRGKAEIEALDKLLDVTLEAWRETCACESAGVEELLNLHTQLEQYESIVFLAKQVVGNAYSITGTDDKHRHVSTKYVDDLRKALEVLKTK